MYVFYPNIRQLMVSDNMLSGQTFVQNVKKFSGFVFSSFYRFLCELICIMKELVFSVRNWLRGLQSLPRCISGVCSCFLEYLAGAFDHSESVWFCLFNSRLNFSTSYYSAPNFFTIQRIRIVLGRCLFFKICSHIFIIFEVKLE